MICNNCGAIFDPSDITTYLEDYGEVFHACPVCGMSDIEETESCEICGEEFRDGEIREGFCLDCLWNEIDYDTALAYIKYQDSLADFMLNEWFESDVRVDSASDRLNKYLETEFKGLSANDELCVAYGLNKNFLEACRYHCLPDYPDGFGVEGGYFAEWFKAYKKGGDQDDNN